MLFGTRYAAGARDTEQDSFTQLMATGHLILRRGICICGWNIPAVYQHQTRAVSKPTYIYVVSDGTYCKIGISVNPEKRLKSLQTGSAKVLRLLRKYELPSRKAAIKLEKQLHRMFWQSRCRHNGEWFLLEFDHLETLHVWVKDIISTNFEDKQN